MIGFLAFLAASPALDSCAWATAGDVAGLKVNARQDEATEARRGDPQGRDERDGLAHAFWIEVTRVARGPHCLKLRWRAVPRGPVPASATDFAGGRWPEGVVVLPAWPTPRDLNPPMATIRFVPRADGDAERNETLGLVLLDASGRTIWGSEARAPLVDGRAVLWQNDTRHNSTVLTIHDGDAACSIPGPGSGFTIRNKREAVAERPYFPRPGITIERPMRPIVQCETVRWRIEPAGPRPARAADFAGNTFPHGTLRFSAIANGSEDQEDELLLPFRMRPAAAAARRTIRVIAYSSHGVIADRVVTLE